MQPAYYENLIEIQNIDYKNLLSFILKNNNLHSINKNIIRNEGFKKSQALENKP